MARMSSQIWRGRNSTLFVALHGREAPTDEEWDVYARQLREIFDSGEGDRMFACNVTLGGAPNAAQRRRINMLIPTTIKPRGIVLTDSSIARGAITAIMWLTGAQLVAFPPDDYQKALRSIGVEADEVGPLLIEMTALGNTVDENPVRALLKRTE